MGTQPGQLRGDETVVRLLRWTLTTPPLDFVVDRVHAPDVDPTAKMSGSLSIDATSLREFNLCTACARLPRRPVIFPACGHSSYCQECAIAQRPKSCPVCGAAVRTPAKRLRVNGAYAALLRAVWPGDYSADDCPADTEELYRIQRRNAVTRLDRAIARTGEHGQHRAELPEGYRERALGIVEAQHPADDAAVVGTHVLRWCACGLVELPKFSRKGNYYFFGCPAWTPFSHKRGRTDDSEPVAPERPKHCGSFARLSKKQRTVLRLPDRSGDRDASQLGAPAELGS